VRVVMKLKYRAMLEICLLDACPERAQLKATRRWKRRAGTCHNALASARHDRNDSYQKIQRLAAWLVHFNSTNQERDAMTDVIEFKKPATPLGPTPPSRNLRMSIS
jgi:hypothetical protein